MKRKHEAPRENSASTHSSPPRLCIQTLPTKPNPHFAKLKHTAFVAVAEARTRCSPEHTRRFTQEERKEAELFLHYLVKAARSEGKRRGDSATAKENRAMLRVLHQLAQNADLKSQVPEGPSGTFDKRHRSLSTRLNRFCRRVYQAVTAVWRTEELTKNPDGTLALTHITRGRFRYALRKWLGINFHVHCPALREALRRGEVLHHRDIGKARSTT